MRPNKMMTAVLLSATALWLSAATESFAGDGHQHGDGHHAADAAERGGAGAEDLQTADGIWNAINAEVERLSQTIETGKLADVHHIAFAIRDLANELPNKSTALSDAKQKMLAGYVSRVAEHATNLDTYGDAGNAKRTAEEFAELQKRLGYMKKLYPKAATAHHEGAAGDAHENHDH